MVAQLTLWSSEPPIEVETNAVGDMLMSLLVKLPSVRSGGCEEVLQNKVLAALAKGLTTPVGYTGVSAE
jgi:hypothetical protein